MDDENDTISGNVCTRLKESFFKGFHKCFEKLAFIIAASPISTLLFLILPIVISVTLGIVAIALFGVTSESDIETLYVPQDAPALKDRKTIEDLYVDFGDDNLLSHQRTRLGLYGQILIEPLDESENVLSFAIMEEVLRLHDYITDISVDIANESHTQSYSYQDLCLMWQHQCYSNGILDVIQYNASNIRDTDIAYPFAKIQDSPVETFIGTEIGGAVLYPNSDIIEKAKVLQLTYNLRYDSDDEERIGKKWENEFLLRVQDFNSSVEINIFRRTSHTLEQELNEASSSIISSFTITFSVLITFSITSCMMLNMLRTKIWLGGMGVISAGLAILTSFGLMTFFGVPYINEVGSMPFLIIGIGVDDMFIMIAAWRKTNIKDTAKERLGTAFSEAASSITVTSLTTILAFGIGAITTFRSVQIFCLYTGVAVAFDYLYQITFFGACMYIDGLREEHKLNGIFPFLRYPCSCLCAESNLEKRDPDEDSEKNMTDPETMAWFHMFTKDDEQEHRLMTWFRNFVAPFMMRKIVSILLGVLYTAYLVLAIYGVTKVQTGLQISNLLPDNSYAVPYYNLEPVYLTKYGPAVMMTINEEVKYWESDVQMEIEQTLKDLETSEYYHGSSITISWIRDFLKFLNQHGITEPNEAEFKRELKTFLANLMYQKYVPDIVFSTQTDDIVSTRSYVTFKDVDSSTLEENAMLEARRIARKSGIAQIAYHPSFTFYDQYNVVVRNTVRNLLIAMLVMFAVALLMMPNFKGAIFALFAIISILIGVVGYMTYWGVYLDTVSMVNLVLCVGFSVDYSAHMILAYFTAPDPQNSEARFTYAVYTHGWPITQGATSTVLGILVLAFSTSYIFRSFFKTMFLVIVFGALHGLIFLPLFMKVFDCQNGSRPNTIV